eukprot:scaffold39224_cov70-Phaeocystis_antarctica.AAC.4
MAHRRAARSARRECAGTRRAMGDGRCGRLAPRYSVTTTTTSCRPRDHIYLLTNTPRLLAPRPPRSHSSSSTASPVLPEPLEEPPPEGETPGPIRSARRRPRKLPRTSSEEDLGGNSRCSIRGPCARRTGGGSWRLDPRSL